MEVLVAPGAGLGVEIRSLMPCWGISIPSLKDSGMGLASGKEAGILGDLQGPGRGWEPSGFISVSGIFSRGHLCWVLGVCLPAQWLQGTEGSLWRSGDHRLEAERSRFKSWLCCCFSLGSHFTCLGPRLPHLQHGVLEVSPDMSPAHPASGWQSQAGSPSSWPRALARHLLLSLTPSLPLPHLF